MTVKGVYDFVKDNTEIFEEKRRISRRGRSLVFHTVSGGSRLGRIKKFNQYE